MNLRRVLYRARALARCLRVYVVAGEQVEARKIVAGDKALNLVKNGGGIQRAHLRLQLVSYQPNLVTIGLTGLRTARLPHVRACASAEWDQLANVMPQTLG